MIINTYTVSIGAEKPFSVYHISDDHFCLADERDNKRKNDLAINRAEGFTGGLPEKQKQTAEEMLAEVRKGGFPLIHTGDLIDFVSYANLDYAKEYFKDINAVVCAGNHEFSLYVGEAWEDEKYKNQSLSAVSAAFPEGIEFGTSMINGVKFITLDDGYYYVTPKQFEMLEKELSDDIPAVLVIHNPIYSEDLYSQVTKGKAPDEPPYLIGVPEELLTGLSEHRFKQQKPDEVTLEFVRLCNDSPNLKAVLAGHMHKHFVSRLDSGIPQFVADGAFNGVMYRYDFI